MNCLIVVYDYFPYETANTFCAQEYIDTLQRRGHNTYVFTVRQRYMEAPNTTIRGSKVYRVYSLAQRLHLTYIEIQSKSIRLLLYPFFKMYQRFSTLGYVGHFYSRHVRRKILSIVNSEGIDLILSVSYPFSAHQLASFVKDNKRDRIVWIAYEIDPFTLNYTLHPSKQSKRSFIEQEVLENANLIITTHEQRKYNESKCFRTQFAKKTLSMDFPLIDFPEVPITNKRSDSLNLFYAGTFYGKYRSPNKLLEILDKLADNSLAFHVYGTRIGVLSSDFSSANVVEHGRVSKGESTAAMYSSDILVSFGNDIPNQTPSKIYDYISSRKPIIHFYYTEEDACLRLLEPYPNKLIISNHVEVDQNLLNSFEHFCRTLHEMPSITYMLKHYKHLLKHEISSTFVDNAERLVGNHEH